MNEHDNKTGSQKQGGWTPADDDFGDWIECWSCAGEGETESCFEDTCVCINPPCLWSRCDVCRGKGGWPRPDEDDGANPSTDQGGE